MRVISGSARGTKLKTVEGLETRPTIDRVKEALFSSISPDVYGSIVLDLFSGSGALGIEALSRGAEACAFVDMSKDSVAVIGENLKKTRLDSNSRVYMKRSSDFIRSDSKSFLRICERSAFDIVFLDPPYGSDLVGQSIRGMMDHGIVSADTVIVCETNGSEKLEDTYSFFTKVKEKKYGKIIITIYRGE
jgi:16S rRNA (guanine966-N2)-methyltransferase